MRVASVQLSAVSLRRWMVLGLVTVVATSCSAVPTKDNQARNATRRVADRMGNHIQNSELVRHYPQMKTEKVVQVAAREAAEVMSFATIEPKKSDSIYQWTELVLRFEGIASDFGSRSVQACWRYVFEGKFLQGDAEYVECPSSPPVAVTVTNPVDLPIDAFNRLRSTLEDLPADSLLSVDAARAEFLAAFPDLNGAILDVAIVDGMIGVTIFDGTDCVMGRRFTAVEVWAPQSDDATAEGAGCPADPAARGEYQIPPH